MIGHNLTLDLAESGDPQARALREQIQADLVRRLGHQHPAAVSTRRRKRFDCAIELPIV
jgi:hypothetical protein